MSWKPVTLDGKLLHVVEEASEVSKAACKALRFGLKNRFPNRPSSETNEEVLRREMSDLIDAINALVESLDERLT